MKKIIILSMFFIVSAIMVGCYDEPDPVNQQAQVQKLPKSKSDKDRAARTGPGYSWNFSTPNQNNPVEYVESPEGNRYYFIKASAGYSRSLTLTITKTSSNTNNPQFRIYGREFQCLTMTTPTVSIGTVTPTTFQQTPWPGSLTYSGHAWTVPLGASPVGTTATMTVTVSTPGSCVEGFIGADMTSPAAINSAGSYWDGDWMYFIKNINL
jgi:hypothetical protein